MDFWLIFIGFVVICLTLLMYTRNYKIQSKEGFENAMVQASDFGSTQDKYFHELAPAEKGFFINPKLSTDGLNEMLAAPDVNSTISPDQDFTKFFGVDPEIKHKSKNKLCVSAQTPKDLPARTGALAECGWYYIDDPTKSSVGLLGTRDGPLSFKNLPEGGEWMWDLRKAQQKEEIKHCKRVKKCSLINCTAFKGKCGFCKSKGFGVPILKSGKQKYKIPLSDLCEGPIVLNGSKCAKPLESVIKTSNGKTCKSFGYPSPNNEMRLYSKTECRALGGLLKSGGVCVSKSGTSYSEECRNLNKPASSKNGPVRVARNDCTPDKNGKLTPKCLVSIARGLGFSESGGMIRIISTQSKPTSNELLAIKTLKANGVPVSKSLLIDGNVDELTAGNAFNKIYEAMKGADTDVKEAATLLVNGDTSFDPCSPNILNASSKIPVKCLQREFRKVGCQASGKAYPKETNSNNLKILPLKKVTSTFQNLYNSMTDAKSPLKQQKAVKNCLGIDIV